MKTDILLLRFLRQYKCYVTILLIVINVLVFGYMFLQKPVFDTPFMYECGALSHTSLKDGDYIRLLTAMFLHFDLQHLGNNMLMLAIIGSTTERYLGSVSFAFVYMIGGILGNIFSTWSHYQSYLQTGHGVVAAGASGAVFAVAGALLCVIIAHKGRLENFTTKKMLLFLALLLYQGFAGGNVDNYAHTGGLAGGIAVGALCCTIQAVWNRKRAPDCSK